MCICPHKHNKCSLFAFQTTTNRVSGALFRCRTLHSRNIYRVRHTAHNAHTARNASNKLINNFIWTPHIFVQLKQVCWTVFLSADRLCLYRLRNSIRTRTWLRFFTIGTHSHTHAHTHLHSHTHTHTLTMRRPPCAAVNRFSVVN